MMKSMKSMKSNDAKYFQATAILDSHHPAIVAFAEKATAEAASLPIAKAVALYYAVRDEIRLRWA